MRRREVERVARVVRGELERMSREEPSLYWEESSLRGACASGSRALVRLLRRFGVDAEFVMGTKYLEHRHCWVLIGDSILDVTATQFGTTFPRVYWTNFDDPTYVEMARGRLAFQRMTHEFPQDAVDDKRLARRIDRQVGRILSVTASSRAPAEAGFAAP